MTALMIVLGYAGIWLGSSVWTARRLTPLMFGRCHGEGLDRSNFTWSYRLNCGKNCKPGCWRSDGGDPTPGQFAATALACLIWPLAFPVAIAYTFVIKPPPAVIDRSDEIARLEREVFGREQS